MSVRVSNPANNWNTERRRRCGRLYTSYTQLSPEHTTANSLCDDGTTAGYAAPVMGVFAGAIAAGPNEIAELTEHLNNEPYGYPEGSTDKLFARENVIDALFTYQFVSAPSAGSYVGCALGSICDTTGIAFAQNVMNVFLRYDLFAHVWECGVTSKFSTGGVRRWVVGLGRNPGGIQNVELSAVGKRMEIYYFPAKRVEFWINGIKVHTFTDADDGGGKTPLADLLATAHLAGATIDGATIFTTTGSGAGKTSMNFFNLYAETVMPR